MAALTNNNDLKLYLRTTTKISSRSLGLESVKS